MGSEWETATFESLIQANVLQIGDGYRAKNGKLAGLESFSFEPVMSMIKASNCCRGEE
jgi:hypothetical protein